MRKIVLTLVLLGGSWSAAGADTLAEKVQELCTLPSSRDKVLVYTIDLAIGAARDKRHYRTSDEVEIVLKNKNPFLFDYRVKVEEQAIPEPALDTFFKVFNASATASLLATITPTPAPTPTLDPAKARSNCDVALEGEAIKRLEAHQKSLVEAYSKFKDSAEETSTLLEALRGALKEQEKPLQNLAADCDSLVAGAVATVTTIQEGLSESREGFGKASKKFSTEFEAFKKDVTAFETLIAAARIVLSDAQCEGNVIDRHVGVFETTLEAFKQSLDPKNEKGLQKLISTFDAATKEIKDREKAITAVLDRPDLFWETHQIGDYDEITLVTLTIDRKKREEKDFPSSHHLVKKLRFGGRQRFALAAGAVYSDLNLKSYKPIQGVPLTEGGVPVPGQPATRVVGLDESSSERILPLIVLHTRLWEVRSWISGVHLSFGFAGETGNNGLNLEYLFGPSISFGEERAFLTVGVYSGRTETLQTGFFVGKPLDASVPDVPVVRGRARAFGLAATYRFR